MAAKKRKITAEDLYRLALITHSEISPDGRYVVYAVQQVNQETLKKHSNLWIVPTRAGRPRQFTYGEQMDVMPRWSPDGNQIAFLSNRGNEKQMQIYLIPFEGGEARPLSKMKGEFGDFQWSPDGKQFVVNFRKVDADALVRETDEQKKERGVVARHITRVRYKFDGQGYLPQERWHLWTVNARTGRAKQLTDHQIYHEWGPAWSPDGKQIAYMTNRAPDPDFEPDAIDLYVLSLESGRKRKIETPYGEKHMPSFSPDGKWIAYYGAEGKGTWWKNTRLYRLPASGRGEVENLTAEHDFNVSSWTINDTQPPGQMPPTWSTDGGRIYFQVAHHGNTLLKSIDLQRMEIRDEIAETGVVGTFTFSQDQTKLAYFFGTMDDPGQLMLRDQQTGKTRQLTRINRNWLNRVDLGKIEEVWFNGSGKNKLHGWVLKPPGFRANRKYPSILEIHGGPQTQYGNYFMHEFYFLAAQGYVVYFSNPRGGQGYGEAHTKAIWNDWGTKDYQDLMAWADYMQKQPYIDKERMGVTGGSYGGYMTLWIIGQTQRFKAAVAQRVVSNLVSMWGSSDFNWVFQWQFGEKPPWENLENYWRMSPMKHIGNAKTPTLIIHSEQDMRTDQEQGEQAFVALKYQGVDSELVLFPNEPHGLSRGGRTDRRIERLNHILRWFDKYLKGTKK